MNQLGKSPEQILYELEAVERQQSSLDGERLRLLAEYRAVRARDGEYGLRSASAEIGLALHIGANYAADQMEFAHSLIERLPDTFAALSAGRIDRAKARALVDITLPLSMENARTVEAKILPTAGVRTVSQLRSSARYQRDRVDPEAAELRRQRAKEERRVSFEPLEDGSAELLLQGPGERAFLAWLYLDTEARRQRAAGDKRTLDALRHDVMVDCILGKHDSRVTVTAYLHVPATTLAGITTDPGVLAGYGPVTQRACQELAAKDATWRRVFADPVTGVVKDLDRKSYRPSASLAEFIQVRDGTCIAPGCTKPAHQCQIDHTVKWADGGATCDGNLDALCWPDHRLKELTGWTLEQPTPGRYIWISPIGQRYDRMPESLIPM